MKFRLLATIMAILAGAHTARAQATFPPETDNAALRYWFALAAVWEPPDDDAPQSDDKIRAYEEYMLAAQAALREPPAEAKSRIADLESNLRRLGKVEQNLIPGLRGTNESRIRLATAHQELMQALSTK